MFIHNARELVHWCVKDRKANTGVFERRKVDVSWQVISAHSSKCYEKKQRRGNDQMIEFSTNVLRVPPYLCGYSQSDSACTSNSMPSLLLSDDHIMSLRGLFIHWKYSDLRIGSWQLFRRYACYYVDTWFLNHSMTQICVSERIHCTLLYSGCFTPENVVHLSVHFAQVYVRVRFTL